MIMKTNQFHRMLEKYLTVYLKHEKNASRLTICSYRDTFVLLLKYYRDELSIPSNKIKLEDITKLRIQDFLIWLVKKRHCSMNTRNHRLCAIRAFVKYLQYEDVDNIGEWQKILAIPMAKYNSPRMKYLSPEGVKLLLKQPDPSSKMGRRHLAILAMLCDTGARVQEIIDLRVSDVRLDVEPYTAVITGKGRKIRVVPLISKQANILKRYMTDYGLDIGHNLSQVLFSNARGEKLTRAGMRYILDKYVDMAHKENPELMPGHLSCHCLRHTKAMNLLKANVSLRHIRDLLGHASIITTEHYAKADTEMERKALEEVYSKTNPDIIPSPIWKGDNALLDWLQSLK